MLAETGESSQGRALLAKLLYCVLWRLWSEGKVDAHRWVPAPLNKVTVRWGAAGVGGLVVLVAASVVKLPLEPASETDDLLMKLASVRRAVAHGFSPRVFLFGWSPSGFGYMRQSLPEKVQGRRRPRVRIVPLVRAGCATARERPSFRGCRARWQSF